MNTRRKRGRPSAGDLSTIAPLPAMPRLPRPPELAGEEAEEWLALVNAHPADWFGPGARPALVQLCRHIVQARRIAELIEAAVGKPDTELGYYTKLLEQQRAETQAIARLGAALRLNPQSLRNDRGNARPRPGPAPWEL